MKSTHTRGAAAAGLLLLAAPFFVAASAASEAPDEGIALAIVYDTSGSMIDPVADRAGKSEPKYVIASRALKAVVDRLDTWRRSPGHPKRPVRASLVVFAGSGAREEVPFGDFDPKRLHDWADAFSRPTGGTPLGEAIRVAAKPLLTSGIKHKHILVITDGMNTLGEDPVSVIRKMQKENADTAIHCVGFDVAARVFEPLKQLGVTVVSAANEAQLNTQLNFILEEKILLEDEETPVKTAR